MIYHVDPVRTTLGKPISELYQVHTQEEHDLKWDFKAIVRITKDEAVLDVEGNLSLEERIIVLNRTAHLRGVV